MPLPSQDAFFSKLFDASLPRQDLIYLDVNKLYGWAMPQSLPTHGFRFLSEEDIPDDGDVGYILKVDLHYPTSLTIHSLLNHW